MLFTALKAQIPEKPTGYVNDFVGVLHAAEKQQLEEKLTHFEEQTSNQIFVLIYPSLQGKAIEEFTHEVARKWRIGQKDKNNGVLLAIFVNERKIRIEVGYGLEGALPDITAKQIIENNIKPALRSNHYYQAIEAGTTAIIQATKGEYTGTGQSAYKTKSAHKKRSGVGLFTMIFVVGLIILIFISAIRSMSRNGRYTYGGGY
ncbi:MAG: TPM domain-containing protein, partial [Bacteroidia bacterium]|nr:TPM domain-containing protein [Bacteroidia bacterium]